MTWLPQQYMELWNDLRLISKIYGGFSALLKSPYFHASIIISLLCKNFWILPGWWDLPIAVLPNLIGFTLGGYAILLAFGDSELKELISGSSDEKPSAYLCASATFAHFIFVQVLALILAIISKSSVFNGISCSFAGAINDWINLDLLTYAVWGVFFTVFTYALTLLIAAVFAVFHLTKWADKVAALKASSRKINRSSHDNNS